MSYVDDNLTAGEQVLHRAKLHWGIFVGPGILLFIGFIIAIAVGAGVGGGGAFLTLLILLLFTIPILLALKTYLTTEFAVTSRRVIVKEGFIRRIALELNHNRVEGLAVQQGVIARIFNAGTIVVMGTGGTKQSARFINNPMEFRRNALEVIDANS